MNAKTNSTELLPDLPRHSLAITEHAPLPMATVEGATHIVRYANPAFCKLMGESIEKLIGRPLQALLPEKDQCVTLLDRVFRTGRPESHVEQEHSKPHPVFWAYTMWPVQASEGLVGVMIQVTETAQFHETAVAMNEALLLGSVRQHELTGVAEQLNVHLRAEIAERQRVEAALRASKALFSGLVEQAPFGMYVVDARFKLQQVNRRAMPVFSSIHPLIGRDFSEVIEVVWGADVGGQIASVVRQTLETGESYLSPPFTARRRDIGVEQSYEWELQRITLPNSLHAVVCYFADVSERRAMEAALASHAADLVRADRNKDEFLAMLAHELRNPLAPLRNAAEILRTTDADADASEHARQILDRQIENMTRMIDDLLDVSRITEGRIELRLQTVELGAIIDAAAHLAQPGIAAREQQLAITLPAEPVFLNADATRLEQVFGNLLTNACKYSNPGSHISLSADCAPARGEEPPHVTVRVKDDGIGIAAEMLPHIFDLFVQATGAPERAQGGLGIGLTLVDRLVKLHGGSVAAHSGGLDQGSEFIVRLPILEGAVAPTPPMTASPARDTPRRMLIVDDNRDSATSMSTLQRVRGHETRIAFSGPAAVAAAAEFVPDVVLLDLGLPGMDGFEVARRLRAMPALAGAFIVAISGYGRPDDLARARAAGFDEHLVKPADLDLLREWLRSRV
jgi:PAS domain S-box-containing protein